MSCSRCSGACACCASGAASWTPARTPARSSPRRPVEGIYINGGWGTGGFKATPGSGHVYAHTIANDEPHPNQRRVFKLDRFTTAVSDRRARRRRRGPLSGSSSRTRRMLTDPLPLLRAPRRDRVHLRRRGACRAPEGPGRLERCRMGRIRLSCASNTKGVFLERWVHSHGCRPLVQRGARHRELRDPGGLRDRRKTA